MHLMVAESHARHQKRYDTCTALGGKLYTNISRLVQCMFRVKGKKNVQDQGAIRLDSSILKVSSAASQTDTKHLEMVMRYDSYLHAPQREQPSARLPRKACRADLACWSRMRHRPQTSAKHRLLRCWGGCHRCCQLGPRRGSHVPLVHRHWSCCWTRRLCL